MERTIIPKNEPWNFFQLEYRVGYNKMSIMGESMSTGNFYLYQPKK